MARNTISCASRAEMHPPAGRRSENSLQLQELEKRVHEFVQEQAKTPCSAQVCKRADEIAVQLGMTSFKSSVAWYNKFLKRYANRERTAHKDGKARDPAKRDEDRPMKGNVSPGSLQPHVSSPAGAAATAPVEPAAAGASEQGPPMPALPHAATSLAQGHSSGAVVVELPSISMHQSGGMPAQQPPSSMLINSHGARSALAHLQPPLTHDHWGAMLSNASSWVQSQGLHPRAGMHMHPGDLSLAMHGPSIAQQQMQRQQVLHALQQQQHQQLGGLTHWDHGAAAAHPMQQQVASMHVAHGGTLTVLDAAQRDGGQVGNSSCSVNLKASLKMPSAAFPVMRRVRVTLELDANGIPVNGYELVTQVLTTAFKDELQPAGQAVTPSLMGLTYVDEDGDDIMISSNHELAVGIHYAIRLHQAQRGPGSASAGASDPTLRLTLHCSNSVPRQPQQADMHVPSSQLAGSSAEDGPGGGAGAAGGIGLSNGWGSADNMAMYPGAHK